MRSNSVPLARSTTASAAFGYSSSFSLAAFAFSSSAFVAVSGSSTRLPSGVNFGVPYTTFPSLVTTGVPRAKRNSFPLATWRTTASPSVASEPTRYATCVPSRDSATPLAVRQMS